MENIWRSQKHVLLDLIGRSEPLFETDYNNNLDTLKHIVTKSSFLVIGGAGTIGQAVVKEIFQLGPKRLYVVDISENNLVELVRDVRSSFGYLCEDFKTFAIDVGTTIYDSFAKQNVNFDYILNLSALKHVRSEKDPYTLMRMLQVNILNTIKTVDYAIMNNCKKYFCVSTDKAANPVNLMGASKQVMEMCLFGKSSEVDVSTARFANVAFSDGSLLHGFNQRIQKQQPIVAPKDVKRYFVTEKEAGQLCMLSCLLGENRDIFFPKLDDNLHLVSFADIACKYLASIGFEPHVCSNEDEARALAETLPKRKCWPCLFTDSDTTGEKSYEEFYTDNEVLNLGRFADIGIIKKDKPLSNPDLDKFINDLITMIQAGDSAKEKVVAMFKDLLPNFTHMETGKYLDGKM